MLDRHLEREAAVVNSILSRWSADMSELDEAIARLNEQSETLLAKRSKLDTNDLTKLETSNARQEHQRQGLGHFHFTPNLIVHLTTAFPIRDVQYRCIGQPDAWKEVQYSLGGHNFKATLKTGMLSNAVGEVILRGWSREIHASEIAGLTSSLLGVQDSLMDSVACKKSLAEQMCIDQVWAANLSNRRNLVMSDRALVESMLSDLSNNDPDLFALAEAESISSVASRLALESVVDPGELNCASGSGNVSFAPLQEWLLELIGSFDEYAQQSVESFATDLTSWKSDTTKFIFETESAVQDSDRADFTALKSEIAGSSMHIAAQQDISRQETALGSFKQKFEGTLTTWKQASGEDNVVMENAARELLSLGQESQSNLESCREVNIIMNAPNKPIGYAVAMAVTSPTETWVSAFKGLRIQRQLAASNHSSTVPS